MLASFLRHALKLRFMFLAFIGGLAIFGMACSPVYTWNYAHAAHPVATASYIRAVLARERGDYELSIAYYEMALRREYSEKVRAERDDVIYKWRVSREPSGGDRGAETQLNRASQVGNPMIGSSFSVEL